MELTNFCKTYALFKRLQAHIEGGVKNNDLDLALAKELLLAFPEFRYEGFAYRAILGEWKDGFSNICWSEYETSSWYAFDSVYINKKTQRRVYRCKVSGFNVGALVEAIENEIDFFLNGSAGHAREECEILAISYDLDSLEEMVDEDAA